MEEDTYVTVNAEFIVGFSSDDGDIVEKAWEIVEENCHINVVGTDGIEAVEVVSAVAEEDQKKENLMNMVREKKEEADFVHLEDVE